MLTGFVDGTIYALIAVALVLVYQITGVVNFAFTSFGMVAAYCFDTLTFNMNPWLAFAIVVVGGVLIGGVIGFASQSKQNSSQLNKAVACLGILTALQGLVLVVWGPDARTTPVLTHSVAFNLFGIAITWQRVLVVAVGLIGTALGVAFFRYGSLGSALRAMATSTRVSQMVGLPIRRLWILSWMISVGVASATIVLVLPEEGLDPGTLTLLVLVPLSAAFAARFRSIGVAFCSAIGLGIVQGVFEGSSQLSPYVDALPLALALVSVAMFPSGQTYERV